jgi:NAD(P)-dependent dehydrogenase (short-subunit alcohol dehydrogenase family)
MGRLTGKVILITGASGIGAATARMATREGAQVFIAALSAVECESLAKELNGNWLAGDLSDEANAIAAVQSCVDHFGRIDGVFNVAGISGRRFGDGPLHQCSAEGWDTLMTVNARSLFLVSRESLRHMLARGGGGAIVNMASVLAFSPEAEYFATHAYAASKGAILSLTTSAAAYYAKSKIRINAVAPGLVETPMSKRAQENAAIGAYIATKQPLAEGFISADDVAAAVIFLMSEEARYITGEVIAIDGGWRVSR